MKPEYRIVNKVVCLLIFIIILGSAPRAADNSISGPALDTLMAAQNLELQKKLETQFDESQGYLVTGPFDPRLDILEVAKPIFNSVRVLVPDRDSYYYGIRDTRERSIPVGHAGYDGHLYKINIGDRVDTVLMMTYNQNRYLIWLKRVTELGWNTVASPKLARYTISLRNYFGHLDTHNFDVTMPPAEKFVLPESIELFAPDPDPVFENNSAYIALLDRYKSINLPIVGGDTVFVMTPEKAAWFKDNAPYEAFPNKSVAHLQEEYRDFIQRNGDLTQMKVLTKKLFDNLNDGEYIFAVSLTGKIRIAVKLTADDIARIEKATGQKPPVPSQALLFPGEPVLTAGSFVIDASAQNRLAFINAYSEPYFYSKIDPSVKENIAERSDHYLLTLGHLFKSLDSLGIDYSGARISKFSAF